MATCYTAVDGITPTPLLARDPALLSGLGTGPPLALLSGRDIGPPLDMGPPLALGTGPGLFVLLLSEFCDILPGTSLAGDLPCDMGIIGCAGYLDPPLESRLESTCTGG